MRSYVSKLLGRGGVYPKVVFFHIQKTAGSSIVEMVQEKYHRSMVTHGYFVEKNISELLEFDFISGHFGFSYAQSLVKDRFSFTFLRQPSDRVLSLYFFCRQQPSNKFPIYKKAKDYSLEDFLLAGFDDPIIKRHIWNHQTWQMASGRLGLNSDGVDEIDGLKMLDKAKKNLSSLDFYGLSEFFSRDSNIVSSQLGLGLDIFEGSVNKSIRPLVNHVSNRALDLLNELNTLDNKLYSWALDNWNEPKK